MSNAVSRVANKIRWNEWTKVASISMSSLG